MTMLCPQAVYTDACTLLSKLLRGLCLCLAVNGYQNPQPDVTTLWKETNH
jgi:hypothetical protein